MQGLEFRVEGVGFRVGDIRHSALGLYAIVLRVWQS